MHASNQGSYCLFCNAKLQRTASRGRRKRFCDTRHRDRFYYGIKHGKIGVTITGMAEVCFICAEHKPLVKHHKVCASCHARNGRCGRCGFSRTAQIVSMPDFFGSPDTALEESKVAA